MLTRDMTKGYHNTDIHINKNSRKTVMLGSDSVGKTSLVQRLQKDTFSDSMEATIGYSR